MENLNIRDIKKSDCNSVSKLIKELVIHKGDPDKDTVSSKDLDRLGFNVKYGPFFHGIVGEIKEKEKKPEIIGVALYHCKYSTWEGPVMEINTFIVTQAHQRNGVGSKLLHNLAKIAQQHKYSRISLEVCKNNTPAMSFFIEKHGGVNLTLTEAWLNYELNGEDVKKLLKDPALLSLSQGKIQVRPTEPKDCARIKEMIQELADFEKMPDGPQLSEKDLQRDGFYKLYPDFYSFVAEMETEEDVEIVGYVILSLIFDPIVGKRVHLEDIYVDSKHRGKSVGQMLFKTVVQFVEKEGYAGFTWQVLDWNVKAVQFYDKYGARNLTCGENAKETLRFKKDGISTLASS